MKQIILTITLVFFLLIIIPFGLTFGIRLIPGEFQPSLKNTERIYQDTKIYQSFVSPEDNFTGIGVSLKNPNLANKEDVIVKIYNDKGDLIRKATLNGRSIEDGNFVKFLDTPVKQSKGKKFTWSIAAPTATYDNALQVFLTDDNPPWSLDLKINDKIVKEDLSYVTFHKPLFFTEILNLVCADVIRKLRGDPQFAILYSVLLVTLLISLSLSIKKTRH